VYPLPNPRKTFEMLDIVEDARSYRPERSRFRRGIIRVRTADQRSIVAWTYLFGGYTANLRIIPSGNWRDVYP
ncbi:MAG: gamma-glutamylcyclotransferase, partial [Syntrophales bacterium]|nr:gamma-glutamylcyclotransferase [Syntrophales bacterium]